MLRIAWRKPNASIGGQYTWQKKKGEEIEGYIIEQNKNFVQFGGDENHFFGVQFPTKPLTSFK